MENKRQNIFMDKLIKIAKKLLCQASVSRKCVRTKGTNVSNTIVTSGIRGFIG